MSFRNAVVLALVGGGAWLVALPGAWAQGCSMCKLSVQAGGEQVAKAMDLGIFVLLVPTVMIFLGIFYFAFYRERSESLSGHDGGLSEPEQAEVQSQVPPSLPRPAATKDTSASQFFP